MTPDQQRIALLEQERNIFEQAAHAEIDANEHLRAHVARLEGVIERLGPILSLDLRLAHIPLDHAEQAIHARLNILAKHTP
jgi:hypothetical protein